MVIDGASVSGSVTDTIESTAITIRSASGRQSVGRWLTLEIEQSDLAAMAKARREAVAVARLREQQERANRRTRLGAPINLGRHPIQARLAADRVEL